MRERNMKKQNIPTIRTPAASYDVVIPIAMFTVVKGEPYVTTCDEHKTRYATCTNCRDGRTMQRWTLVTEMSDLHDVLSANRVEWMKDLKFTVNGTRGDVNFKFMGVDMNGEEIAGWRYTPETVTDIAVLERADTTILIIND